MSLIETRSYKLTQKLQPQLRESCSISWSGQCMLILYLRPALLAGNVCDIVDYGVVQSIFCFYFIFDLTVIHNNNGFTLSYLTPGGSVMKYTLIEELAGNGSRIFSQWLLFRNGEYEKNWEAVKSFICFLGVTKFPNGEYCTNLLGKIFMDGLAWKMTLWLLRCLYEGERLDDRWLHIRCMLISDSKLWGTRKSTQMKDIFGGTPFSVSSKLSDRSVK